MLSPAGAQTEGQQGCIAYGFLSVSDASSSSPIRVPLPTAFVNSAVKRLSGYSVEPRYAEG